MDKIALTQPCKNAFIKNYKHKPYIPHTSNNKPATNTKRTSDSHDAIPLIGKHNEQINNKIKVKYYSCGKNGRITAKALYTELENCQSQGFTHIVNISVSVTDILKYKHYFEKLQFRDSRVNKHIALST